MTVWTRASIVLSAVGVALLALAAVAAAGPLRVGAEFSALVPLFLGVGLKGVLALVGAAVMAHAARLERRRVALAAARAAAAVAPAAAAAPERRRSTRAEGTREPVLEEVA